MDIEKPAYTTNEIEEMRLELENIISKYGLNSPLALASSKHLDKAIAKEIERRICD